MRQAPLLSTFLALLVSLPAAAALPVVPAEAATAAIGGEAGASYLSPLESRATVSDPGPSLYLLPIVARVADPHAPDALAPLRAGPLLEVGSGPRALLAQHMIGRLGFAPEQMHAADPRMADDAHSAAPAENFRRVSAENLPEDWNGRFRHVITFFTFNPEIVDGSTPGMGRGIDVQRAAARIAAVLESGGRLLVVTGGANGLDESAEAAFRQRLILKGRLNESVHVFEKP